MAESEPAVEPAPLLPPALSARTEALALVSLWTAGVSWPLLSSAAGDVPSLLTRGIGPASLLALALMPSLLAPALMLGLLALARSMGGPLRSLPAAVTGLLLAASLLHVFARLLPANAEISGDVLLVLSALLAGGATAAWLRWPALRRLAARLSPVALLVPALFLWDPAMRPLFTRPAGAPAAAPVVLLVFDDLPMDSLLSLDGGIEPGLFPNLRRLAADGLLFRNASTVDERPERALEALVTGQRRGRDGEPGQTLFSLLGSTHEPVVFGSAARKLCHADLLDGHGPPPGTLLGDAIARWARVILPRPFDQVVAPLPGAWQPPDARRRADPPPPQHRRPPEPRAELSRPELVHAFGSALAGGGRPPVALLHSSLSALPWTWLPDGKHYASLAQPEGLENGLWTEQSWPPVVALQRHLLQLGLMDELLGKVLDDLQAADLYDDALIVFCATRGASFAPGTRLSRPGPVSAPDVLSVPLIVKAPALWAQKGNATDRNVELIDILPTLAELLHRPVDPVWDGSTMLTDAPAPLFKSCTLSAGPPVVIPGLVASPRPALEARARAFGPSPAWAQVEGLSPQAGLTGVAVSGRNLAGLNPSTAQLYGVTGGESEATCLLRGQLLLPQGGPLPQLVAVAVDHVLAGATRTHRLPGGQAAFEILVPALARGTGSAHLALYAPDPDGDLALIEVVDWTVETDEQGLVTELLGSNGRRASVRPRALQGFLDQAEQDTGGVRMQGWAVDRLTSRTADTLLVFVENRFVFAGTTGVERPELLPGLGDERLLGAGFDALVPTELLGPRHVARTTLYAVVDDVAMALPASRGGRWLLETTWTLDGERLLGSDERSLTLADPDLWGTVEQAEIRDERLWIFGWSVDVSSPAPVDEILVLVDGRSVHGFLPGTGGRPVADILGGREVPGAGFLGEFPVAWCEGDPVGRITVVARVGQRAAVLRFAGAAAW